MLLVLRLLAVVLLSHWGLGLGLTLLQEPILLFLNLLDWIPSRRHPLHLGHCLLADWLTAVVLAKEMNEIHERCLAIHLQSLSLR